MNFITKIGALALLCGGQLTANATTQERELSVGKSYDRVMW